MLFDYLQKTFRFIYGVLASGSKICIHIIIQIELTFTTWESFYTKDELLPITRQIVAHDGEQFEGEPEKHKTLLINQWCIFKCVA